MVSLELAPVTDTEAVAGMDRATISGAPGTGGPQSGDGAGLLTGGREAATFSGNFGPDFGALYPTGRIPLRGRNKPRRRRIALHFGTRAGYGGAGRNQPPGARTDVDRRGSNHAASGGTECEDAQFSRHGHIDPHRRITVEPGGRGFRNPGGRCAQAGVRYRGARKRHPGRFPGIALHRAPGRGRACRIRDTAESGIAAHTIAGGDQPGGVAGAPRTGLGGVSGRWPRDTMPCGARSEKS